MTVLLKQNTAVNIALGPFVDSTDGVTPEDSLTISQADVRLKKNDGNWAQKSDSNAATHEENGWYEVALDTTDTNTLGTLIVAVNEDGALPVWREFQVVPANVYDAMVAGSDNLQVDTTQIAGAAVSTSSAQIGVNVVASSDTGINSRFAQQDTGAVASAVWGFASRPVTNVTGFSDTGVNDRLGRILADTDTGLKDEIATLDTGLRALIAAEADGNLAMIRGDTGAADRLLKLAGSQLKEDGTFDTGTGQPTNTFNIEADVLLDTGTPVNVQVDTGAIIRGVWGAQRSGHNTPGSFGEHLGGDLGADTGMVANAVWNAQRSAHADTGTFGEHLGGELSASASVDTGAIANAVWAKDTRTLTDFHDTGINQRLDVIRGDTDTGLRAAITASMYSDTGIVTQLGRVEAQTDTGRVVNAVWNAQRSAHGDTGSFGEHLGGSIGGSAQVDTGQIVNAVWGAQRSAHTEAGSFGEYDTGAALNLERAFASTPSYLQQVHVTRFSDTGVNNRLAKIQADTDTGIKSAVGSVSISDTGIMARLTAIQARTDKLTFDTGNELQVDIRKVNNVTVTGTGDTGAGDTWRPA